MSQFLANVSMGNIKLFMISVDMEVKRLMLINIQLIIKRLYRYHEAIVKNHLHHQRIIQTFNFQAPISMPITIIMR